MTYLKSGVTIACMANLLLLPTAVAQQPVFPEQGHLPASVEKDGNGMRVTPEARPLHYFGWEHSPNLKTHWTMAAMALGSPTPTFYFQPDPLVPRDFFRVRAIDKWSPGDADGDCIDDLYELHNGLNPLYSADANAPSAANQLLTNLEYYRGRFGLYEADGSPQRKEYFSEEVSVAIWPSAISPEISVFLTDVPNPTIAEAISDEMSVFKATAPLAFGSEAISAEVSVFKATAPLAFGTESISAEVSVLKNP